MKFLPLLFLFSTPIVYSEPDLDCYIPNTDTDPECDKRWSFRFNDSQYCKEMLEASKLPGPNVCEDNLYISVVTLDENEKPISEVDIKLINKSLMGIFPTEAKYLQIKEFASSLDTPFKRKKVLAKQGNVSASGIDSSFLMFEKSPPEEMLRIRTDENFEETTGDLKLFNYGCVIKTITDKSAKFVFSTQVSQESFESHTIDREVNYFQAALDNSKFPVKVTKVNDQFKLCHVRVRACLDLYTNMFDLDSESNIRVRNQKQTNKLLNTAGFVFKYVFTRFGADSTIVSKISKLGKDGSFTLYSKDSGDQEGFIKRVLKAYEYAEGYGSYDIQKCLNEHLSESQENNEKGLKSKVLLIFTHRPLLKTQIKVEEMAEEGWKVVYIGTKDLPMEVEQKDAAEKLEELDKHIEYFSEQEVFKELDKKLNFLSPLCKESKLKRWILLGIISFFLLLLLALAVVSFMKPIRREKLLSKDFPLNEEQQEFMDLSSMCRVNNTHIVIR